ncbi:MAG: DUF4276 family protein [Burkholderiaceae bacterium]|nr:DUF4276 family protein [Burkholderiaceae bacterium]
MKRFYLLVEGQTEETFVRELLKPHYERIDLNIIPIIVSTSPGHKGGVTSYSKVKPQLIRLCKQEPSATVSTLMDLYALPGDFPGKADAAYPVRGTGRQKAEFIEARWAKEIGERNFLPHLMVHEYEALLFVEPKRFADWTDSQTVVNALTAIAQAHPTPEDINDSPQTAPSKRILKLMPRFEKTFHGPLIAADIGLDALRQACPHFNTWLVQLERLAV